uniref:small monomeric GTPase n=1 Tax=Cyprinodon variegatus TaxID=28743 RepID=A0A3Q2CHE2_CYPVA
MASANATYGQKESSDQNFDYMFKILIIGNSSVGKTSFLFRYADDSFTPAFVSTVGIDFKVKTIYRNDKRIKLQIWVRTYRSGIVGTDTCHTRKQQPWRWIMRRAVFIFSLLEKIAVNALTEVGKEMKDC